MDYFVLETKRKRLEDTPGEDDIVCASSLQVEVSEAKPTPDEPERPLPSLDAGTYIGNISNLNDQAKYELLTKHWTPPKNYIFPFPIIGSYLKRL